MLARLQIKTLMPLQLIGYAVSLVIGVFLVLVVAQAYIDLRPVLSEQAEVFESESAILTKKVSVFSSVDKGRIYFTSDEIDELREQPYIDEVGAFNSASFQIWAVAEVGQSGQSVRSDLFFESVPNRFVDVQDEAWKWEDGDTLIPIIVPKDYIDLYNFGFAESQGLPVMSESTVKGFAFKIILSGAGRSDQYYGAVVGFSNKLNSILVPDEFMRWANSMYGTGEENRSSRLLISLDDPTDERFLTLINENGYILNEEKLEQSRLNFLFKSSIQFTAFLALVIMILSIGFLSLSINLMMQKHEKVIRNLWLIGYSHVQISRFYQLIITGLTLVGVTIALTLAFIFRAELGVLLSSTLKSELQQNWLWLYALGIFVLLSGFFSWRVYRKVKS